MIEKLRELWWEFRAWNDEVQWQNSPERRELAVQRIAQLKAFTSGESTFNQYKELMEE